MSTNRSLFSSNILNKSDWFTCRCGNYAPVHILAEGEERHETDDYYSNIFYKVLRCQSCNALFLVKWSGGYGEWELNQIGDESYSPDIRFRPELLYSSPINPSNEIPSDIADVIKQATAVSSASPRACFILCRASLEEICRQHGVSDPKLTLKERLDKLIIQEALPKDLSQILHGIRELGNEGAHGAQVNFAGNVSSEDAEQLIQLTDFILNKLYVDKQRAERAQKQLETLKLKVMGHQTTKQISSSAN